MWTISLSILFARCKSDYLMKDIIIIIIALQYSEDLDMVSDEQKLVLNENET